MPYLRCRVQEYLLNDILFINFEFTKFKEKLIRNKNVLNLCNTASTRKTFRNTAKIFSYIRVSGSARYYFKWPDKIFAKVSKSYALVEKRSILVQRAKHNIYNAVIYCYVTDIIFRGVLLSSALNYGKSYVWKIS